MNKSKSTLIWGLIITIVGVIFLGNSLNFWNISIFFRGWWTLFIIVPSLIGLFKKQTIVSSILGLIIGILLFLACQDIIQWQMVGKIFIPLLIIVIGISLIVSSSIKKKIKNKNNPEYISIFSGRDEKLTGSFKGANIISIFGGVDLDLRKTEIKDDITIECLTIFGGIDLKLPSNVKVKLTGTPIFGGVENLKDDENEKSPTVTINYICIFAGIDIK